MENNSNYVYQIIDKESSAIKALKYVNDYDDIINFIYEQIHNKNGKIVTAGVGKAGSIANLISDKFSSTGTPAIFLHPLEAQHGDLGCLQKDDVLILVSNSGKTREILELYHLAKNLYDSIKTIVITGNEKSELVQLCDKHLITGTDEEICPLGLTPTLSTTLMNVISNVLVCLMIKKTNFTKEEYNKRHHSGYLGDKSKN